MLRVPYPVLFVIIGLIAGVLHIVQHGSVPPELIMFLFLPPLLFEAAWNLDAAELRTNWLPVALLATFGVWISMGITALVMLATHQVQLTTALLFGAIVAATDPVSVVAVFRRLGLDKRLIVLLEGESLLNDGTAVALFNVALLNALKPATFSWAFGTWQFVWTLLGGVAVGVLIGWLAEQITRRISNNLVELLLTAGTAYLSFWAADRLGVSPVLSVVSAAMLLGNYGKRDISQRVWDEVDQFWSIIALIVNSIVFFLIGVEARVEALLSSSALVVAGIAAVLASRVLVVWPLCAVSSLVAEKISQRWQALIYWGGLRGALSMIMALSLPLAVPERRQLIVLTFGVVLFTLLFQGLTIGPLVSALRLKRAQIVEQQ